jgi:hypothetical protein
MPNAFEDVSIDARDAFTGWNLRRLGELRNALLRC